MISPVVLYFPKSLNMGSCLGQTRLSEGRSL